MFSAGIHKPSLCGDMELARLPLYSSCSQDLLLPEILSHFLNAVSYSLWATKQRFLMLGQFFINKV